MYIYIFTSKLTSYYSGSYCFVANKLGEAYDMAKAFQTKHNNSFGPIPGYTIDFRGPPKVLEIKPGYLPLRGGLL